PARPPSWVKKKSLTEMVGLPLFEHVGNRVYLTDAGHRLYAGCHQIFHALSNLDETLNSLRAIETGHLRLAVGSTAKYLAPRMLGAFMQRYPAVQASLAIQNRPSLIDRLPHKDDGPYISKYPTQ